MGAADPERPALGFQAPPANTARQIGALCVAPGVVAFLVFQSLAPIVHGGLQLWMASWIPDVLLSGAMGAAVGWALVRNSAWFEAFVLGSSRLVTGAYALGSLVGLGALAGLLPKAAPDLGFMNVVNVILYVVFSPLAIATGFLSRSSYLRRQ